MFQKVCTNDYFNDFFLLFKKKHVQIFENKRYVQICVESDVPCND